MSRRRMLVEEAASQDGQVMFDLVCLVCGGRFSLVPDEALVVQVRAFSERHYHVELEPLDAR